AYTHRVETRIIPILSYKDQDFKPLELATGLKKAGPFSVIGAGESCQLITAPYQTFSAQIDHADSHQEQQ
ncbi:MAG: hypothetical protein JSW54_05470, partial [Fidelibacterota bacterium]